MMTKAQRIVRTGLPDLLPRLWRYALILTKDQTAAEELVHATVDSVFERADAFQVGDQLASFCFVRMATAWRHMQNAKAKKKGKDNRFDRMQNLPKAETDTKHSIPTMLSFQLLLDLPEAQRKTVFLTYVEGYRYREVAEILDVPVGTVMNRLAASRKTLQMLSQPRRALKDKTA